MANLVVIHRLKWIMSFYDIQMYNSIMQIYGFKISNIGYTCMMLHLICKLNSDSHEIHCFDITFIGVGTRKKRAYNFRVSGSSNAHAYSLFGLRRSSRFVFFCLKLPQDLYHMSANSKGPGETGLMRRLA